MRFLAQTFLVLLLLLTGCASDVSSDVPAPDPTTPNLFEVRRAGADTPIYWVWSAGGATPTGEICFPAGADWPPVEPVDYVSVGTTAPDGGWCAFVRSAGVDNAIVADWEGAFPPTRATNARPACE